MPGWNIHVAVTQLCRIIRLIDGWIVSDEATARITVVRLGMISRIPHGIVIHRVVCRRSPAGIRMSESRTIGPGGSPFIAASDPVLTIAAVIARLAMITVAPVTGLVPDVVAATVVAIAMAGLLHLS